jgi:hypothetical protein
MICYENCRQLENLNLELFEFKYILLDVINAVESISIHKNSQKHLFKKL